MQRKKSRAELLSALYLNISEIAVLLDVPRPVARKIYVKSQAIDKEQLGDFWIYQNKVRIGSVAKVSGTSIQALERQIKNAAAVEERTAIGG